MTEEKIDAEEKDRDDAARKVVSMIDEKSKRAIKKIITRLKDSGYI